MKTPKDAKRTAYYDQTRDQIIDMAAELFARNGYASTGVAELGEAVGLARGALYYYIGSKESLLAAIHDRVMDPLLREAGYIVKMDLGVEARLRLISESLMRQIVDRHDHVWVFLHEYRQLLGENRTVFSQKRREFEDYIRMLLEEGESNGQFLIEDSELVTLSFLNLHNYTYQWIATLDRRVSVQELSELYCSIVFRGISTNDPDFPHIESEARQGQATLTKAIQQELSQENAEGDTSF